MLERRDAMKNLSLPQSQGAAGNGVVFHSTRARPLHRKIHCSNKRLRDQGEPRAVSQHTRREIAGTHYLTSAVDQIHACQRRLILILVPTEHRLEFVYPESVHRNEPGSDESHGFPRRRSISPGKALARRRGEPDSEAKLM